MVLNNNRAFYKDVPVYKVTGPDLGSITLKCNDYIEILSITITIILSFIKIINLLNYNYFSKIMNYI